MSKMKFVVRSRNLSRVFSDLTRAVDTCRTELKRPCRSSMEKMRLLIDGRVELSIGDDFLFFNHFVDVRPTDPDDLAYVQLYVCEEA